MIGHFSIFAIFLTLFVVIRFPILALVLIMTVIAILRDI